MHQRFESLVGGQLRTLKAAGMSLTDSLVRDQINASFWNDRKKLEAKSEKRVSYVLRQLDRNFIPVY